MSPKSVDVYSDIGVDADETTCGKTIMFDLRIRNSVLILKKEHLGKEYPYVRRLLYQTRSDSIKLSQNYTYIFVCYFP
jgi:hypothetical protein